MNFGLNDHIVNRIAGIACIVALASTYMLWQESIYPISMVVDFFCGTALGIVYVYRAKLSSQTRMSVITGTGVLIGVASVIQTPLYADGYLVLGGVMVLSFTSWTGWRAWLMPSISVFSSVCVAIGVKMGWLDFEKQAMPDTNSVAIWLITAMCMALLALGAGGTIGDFKRKLQDQMNTLLLTNKRLFQAANTDPTTGLANRRRMEEMVNSDLVRGREGCLLLINLSNFRMFNALHGHAQGDAVLLQISSLISRIAKYDLLVASLSGTQFAVWMPGFNYAQSEKFYEEFVSQFKLATNVSSVLGAHAGMAFVDKDTVTFSRLVQNAAVALSDAKTRTDFACSNFSPALAQGIEAANGLKIAIRASLDSDGFYPVYQTKVNSLNGKICGVEGLARMKSTGPSRPPGPVDFIPVIHTEGWMIEFGAVMLRAILKDVPNLVKLYGPETKVSVNISPPLYLASEFLPMLMGYLDEFNVQAKNVVVEITEEVFASSLEEIISVTNAIQKVGVDVSLDDFGTGFSSLSESPRNS